eukprot:292574-Hanusia_phi.AAC.13
MTRCKASILEEISLMGKIQSSKGRSLDMNFGIFLSGTEVSPSADGSTGYARPAATSTANIRRDNWARLWHNHQPGQNEQGRNAQERRAQSLPGWPTAGGPMVRGSWPRWTASSEGEASRSRTNHRALGISSIRAGMMEVEQDRARPPWTRRWPKVRLEVSGIS